MEASVIRFVEVGINYVSSAPWWLLVAQAICVWMALLALRGVYTLSVIRLTGRHHYPQSYARDGKQKILLVGDSTAVGTGSKSEEMTLAGYLARDFPRTTIINNSVNGSLTRAVSGQLKLASVLSPFDIIIISTGGNDVWAFTRFSRLRRDIIQVLEEAKRLSNSRTILIFFGNEGSAPFFPFFLQSFLMWRTARIKAVFAEAARETKVPLIELFSNPRENPFVREPNKFFAPDGLHPNEHGYWEWYKHLWRLMNRQGYTFHEETRVSDYDLSLN